MKIIVITQARTGSTRFPNKIMNKIKNETLLSIHINRIKKSKKINSIIVATTNNRDDDIIELEANNLNVKCYRGKEEDVLDRFYQAAKPYNPDFIVISKPEDGSESRWKDRWGQYAGFADKLRWIDPGLVSRPSLRMLDGIEQLCELIHQ